MALVFALLLAASSGRAALIPRTGDVRVGAVVPDRGWLGCPEVAVGADGAAMVVWTRGLWGRRDGAVMARRVEPDGELRPPIQISAELVLEPSVVALESGGYVAYWRAGRSHGVVPTGLVLQPLDAYGNPAGPPRFVEARWASLAAVGDRLAVVALRYPLGGLDLRLLDREGVEVSPPRQLTAGGIFYDAVASDGSGGLVVAWSEAHGSVTVVRAQAFDRDGQPRGERISVARSSFLQFWPLGLAAAEGTFAVAWPDVSGPSSIELRVFSLAGEPIARPFLSLARHRLGDPSDFAAGLVASRQGVMAAWFARDGGLAAWFDWDGHAVERPVSLPARWNDFPVCGRLATNGRGDWAATWNLWDDELDRNEVRTFSGP